MHRKHRAESATVPYEGPPTASIQSSKTRHLTDDDRTQQSFPRALPSSSPTRPSKRLKTDLGVTIPSLLTTEMSIKQNSKTSLAASLPDANPTVPPPPLEVQHLQGQYVFSTMSVISSSKISHKVKDLLERVERFSFANVNAKPGIVFLQAKASVVSKLISIVEIAKTDIAKRGGKWHTYSKLRREILEIAEEQRKQSRRGRPLVNVGSKPAVDGDASTGRESSRNGATSEGMDIDDGDAEEGGVVFERLQAPSEDVPVSSAPFMSIYFSCVPVPGLEDLYGEQTNA